jgi:hypothetical protein
MFEKLVGAIKALGLAKRAFDTYQVKLKAAMDDIDQDGTPEFIELKTEFLGLVADYKKLFSATKIFCVQCWGLVKHVAEAKAE